MFEGGNPVSDVKMLKEPRQRLRFLEAVEEARLLAECREPLRSIILVGIYCGLRLRGEALALRWIDIDMTRRLAIRPIQLCEERADAGGPDEFPVREALDRLPRHGEFVFAKPNGTPYHAVRGLRYRLSTGGTHGRHPAYATAYLCHATD